ncbi:MAG: T9SS type A sorting domain-containing protein [Sphingobacteriales bacterium]|nr:MAG: T9SS type A sorting domain-containing protein [Sphingobacteriales bacterium]
MKCIYLFLAITLGCFFTATAQSRVVDMALTTEYPLGGIVFVSANQPDGDSAIMKNHVKFKIKNLGPDDIYDTDTVNVRLGGFFGGIASFPANVFSLGIPAGDSLWLMTGSLVWEYEPLGATSSGNFIRVMCDSLWMTDVSGIVINDPDLSNNHNCQNVDVHVWFLDVANVNEIKGFSLYPNPAANRLNLESIFNNAKNANVVVRDVVGKVVLTKNLGTNLNGVQRFILDVSNFTTGIYVIDLNVDGKRVTRQIQVQK